MADDDKSYDKLVIHRVDCFDVAVVALKAGDYAFEGNNGDKVTGTTQNGFNIKVGSKSLKVSALQAAAILACFQNDTINKYGKSLMMSEQAEIKDLKFA